MEDLESIVIKEYDSIPLDKITISESNVRKTKQRVGLEALKTSISQLGLIHPIIVIEDLDSPGRFKLIVGQRRYYAFEELGKERIPALIIKAVNATTEEVASFVENIHRRKLSYSDTIRICVKLFDDAMGDEFTKIKNISRLVGIHPSTVSKYLSYRLVPKEVRTLVTDNKMSAKLAYRITSVFWPNTEKIIAIAKRVTRMTRPEWERALDIGEKSPDASIEDIIEEAKKPRTIYELKIPLSLETRNHLFGIAEERNIDIINLVKNLIEDFLESE